MHQEPCALPTFSALSTALRLCPQNILNAASFAAATCSERQQAAAAAML
jgi:hypothetical protein